MKLFASWLPILLIFAITVIFVSVSIDVGAETELPTRSGRADAIAENPENMSSIVTILIMENANLENAIPCFAACFFTLILSCDFRYFFKCTTDPIQDRMPRLLC